MSTAYGALSLVPPLLAIVLAIITRRAILSLFIGVWAGGVIYTGSLGLGQALIWVAESVGDPFNATLLVFLLLLGAGVSFIWKLGGALAVTNFVASRVTNRRRVPVATWLLGVCLFFSDYGNTAIVGTSMKDISDQMQISREKLSYIVDSTAAPIATFGLSGWVAFQLSMVQVGYENAGIEETAPPALVTLLGSYPYNLYSLLAFIMVGVVVITGRDYGEMLDAERRAQQTGEVTRDGAEPLQTTEDDLGDPIEDKPMLRSFIIPIVMFVAVTLLGAWWTGRGAGGLIETVGEADFVTALMWGAFMMVASGFAIGRGYGLINLSEGMDIFTDGLKLMLTACIILVLAWSIGTVTEELEAGEYVTGLAEGVVTPELLPVVIFLTAAFIAFSIGTAFGTMAIVTPIAIPLAWGLTGSMEMVTIAVGTIFSGAVFGDHTSPISDTTILSATFTGADHIDHVRTQIYYAVTVALVAALLYVLLGYAGVSPLVLIPSGIVSLVVFVYVLSEFDARRKGLSSFADSGVHASDSDD